MVAFALAPIVQAAPSPDGGPIRLTANEAPYPDGGPDPAQAVITVHSTGNVIRGKTGSFVLDMKPALMLGGTYVNF